MKEVKSVKRDDLWRLDCGDVFQLSYSKGGLVKDNFVFFACESNDSCFGSLGGNVNTWNQLSGW